MTSSDIRDFSAEAVIQRLGLELLPGEGGFFRVIERNQYGNSIYFLLTDTEFSAWHRLKEKETWVHIAGDPLELHVKDVDYEIHLLSRDLTSLSHTVTPGEWMAARTTGRWSLVVCYLAPAFTAMELASLEEFQNWQKVHPEIAELIHEK